MIGLIFLIPGSVLCEVETRLHMQQVLLAKKIA